MIDTETLCHQYARILKGKSKIENNVCSVALKRNFRVIVQGRPSVSVGPANVLFESLDQNGNALTEPNILYIHFQSVEHPLTFAKKVANAYSTLTSYPTV